MFTNLANTTKISRNKTSTIIALFLLMAMAFPLIALPLANAHTPSWDVRTFAYIHVSPNPVGVGQTVIVNFWLDKIFDGARITNDWRFHNYNLTIIKPDDTIETQIFDYIPETGSNIYTTMIPEQEGDYTLIFTFPGQEYTDYSYNPSSAYVNDTYLPSSATTTLTVQQEPVAGPTTYPLPTEYWTRPIEGENYNWYTISSNWLGWPQIAQNIQSDGITTNSPHIMWTKPLQFGGVVGGTNVGTDGMTYYTGLSYETKFNPVLIIHGRLYYPLPRSNNGGSALNNGFVCVDLRTGEEIFWQNQSMPSMAQIVDIEDMDQHGAIPNGYMYQVSRSGTWTALDPLDGNYLFSITDVPSGTLSYGPKGELLIYTLNSNAKTLTVWNSTAAVGDFMSSMRTWRPVDKTIDGSAAKAYSLNVSLPWIGSGSRIDRVIEGDLVLGHTGTLPGGGAAFGTASSAPWTMWTINLNASKGTVGARGWTKTYDAPAGNVTITLNTASWPLPVDPEARVFCAGIKETFEWIGYDLDSGEQLWGPVGYVTDDYEYYGQISGGPNTPKATAIYGNLYVAGYGGALQAIDLKTGDLNWLYNNTDSGSNTPFGHYPLFINLISDGKIFVSSSGHGGGVEAPLYRDYRIRCVNATDGTEMWTMLGWNMFTPYGSNLIEPIYAADGYISYLNVYDMQVYCVGKGPSAMTVTAGPKVSMHGDSVVVEGTVVDIAAGTLQNEQAARFPNGVPAVSDESMSDWMEYVYIQKPRPEDVTGVEVVISVLDPNNNCYEVARTASDASGCFGCTFEPEVPGFYKVIATFEGSEGYWGSSAETFLNVKEAPTATPEPTPVPQAPVETYFTVSTVLIIAAIAIVAFLLLRKH